MRRSTGILVAALFSALILAGCGDHFGPTASSAVAPDLPASGSRQLAFSAPSAQTEDEPERLRGNLFDVTCNETQCELALRQGVVVVTPNTEFTREIVGAAAVTVGFPELAELLWEGLPIRAVGVNRTPDGKLIADRVKIDEELIIEGIISVGSEALVPGAIFQLLVESYLGQIEVEVRVPKDKVKPPKVKFPPKTRVKIKGTVPKTIPPVSGGKPPQIAVIPNLPDGVIIAPGI